MTTHRKPLYSPEVHKVSGGWMAVVCDDRSHTVHEYGPVFKTQWQAANSARAMTAAAYAVDSQVKS